MKKISLNDKIFIAGSTGMVGKAIKKILLNNNYEINQNQRISKRKPREVFD